MTEPGHTRPWSRTFRNLVVIAALGSGVSAAPAALVEPGVYASLVTEAMTKGAVPVLVVLDDTVKLVDLQTRLQSVRAAMAQKLSALRAELGAGALPTGQWSNGVGQAGFYVTVAGLRALRGSTTAKSVHHDVTRAYRSTVRSNDGSQEAIEAALRRDGYADVEVLLNTDEADYELGADGRTVFGSASSLLMAEVSSLLARLNGKPFAGKIQNFSSLNSMPGFSARVDREAYYGLRESVEIRALTPVGFRDTRRAVWDAEALQRAQATGTAEVTLHLRGGLTFSPKTGFMSARSKAAQSAAHARALDEILNTAGVRSSTNVHKNLLLGYAIAQLDHPTLARLYAAADPRVLRVELNRAVAQSHLVNSATLVNMPAAWAAGYSGAGQSIVVLDSGVRRDHAMFQAGGVPTVTYEACFGTNQGLYQSICPNQDGLGDNFNNIPGSGEPLGNLAVCNTLSTLPPPNSHECGHGTHVAGIVAGRASAQVTPTNLQGMAIGAGLVAVQVFSYDLTTPRAGAFNADIQRALETVFSATVSGTANPFTVNMSLGGGAFPADCPNHNIGVTDAVDDLTSRGVPVVVSTGNDSDKNRISWPACVPLAIKVASVANDAQGTTLAGFSNIGVPASFNGPILLAPGGSAATTVQSASRAAVNATAHMRGTSQAAPHVAGLYAALKAGVPGITVADATAWVVTSGSIGVTYNLPAPTGTQAYRRIRVPNL